SRRQADGGRVENTAFLSDVLAGLRQAPKAIPARWCCDDEGSRLFEDITRLPEYYLTRAETEILQTRAAELAGRIAPGRAVVEIGSGSSLKTPLLLEAIAPAAYVPLDIAGDFLRESAAALGRRLPAMPIHPVEADFMNPVRLPAEVAALPKLGFFPGSTIGNLVPPAAVDLLRSMRQTLGADAQLLIGMDLVKEPATLEAAYDDPAGVTARFNLNLARRINRELGGTLPLDRLRHLARRPDTRGRIETPLEALAHTRVGLPRQPLPP